MSHLTDEQEALAAKLADAGPTLDEARVWVREVVEQAERAGAVKVLQDLAETNFYDGDSDRPCDGYYDLIDRAMAIENGADL